MFDRAISQCSGTHWALNQKILFHTSNFDRNFSSCPESKRGEEQSERSKARGRAKSEEEEREERRGKRTILGYERYRQRYRQGAFLASFASIQAFWIRGPSWVNFEMSQNRLYNWVISWWAWSICVRIEIRQNRNSPFLFYLFSVWIFHCKAFGQFRWLRGPSWVISYIICHVDTFIICHVDTFII